MTEENAAVPALRGGRLMALTSPELAALYSEVASRDATIVDLRHRLLLLRDRAIGADAEAARAEERARDAAIRAGAEREQRLHVVEQLGEAERRGQQAERALRQVEAQVRAIYLSRSWRLGNAVLRPLARIRDLWTART